MNWAPLCFASRSAGPPQRLRAHEQRRGLQVEGKLARLALGPAQDTHPSCGMTVRRNDGDVR